MGLKDDTVRVKGISTELLFGLMVANDVYKNHGQELIITSLVDGKHSETSLHYDGDAADLRTYFFKDKKEIEQVAQELRERLGPDFDIVVEKDHIHMEFQPKYRK